MGKGSALVFNIITIIFLALTIGAVIFVVMRLAGPPVAAQAEDELPALLVLPSLTPSHTPSTTPRPSFTPTPTDTLTPTATLPPTDTLAPTSTITDTPGPTDTPSDTPTPSISPTLTATETPTEPTDTPTATTSPFLFELREQQVIFTQNFANSAGCAWQGIGGQVFDENGNPLPGLRVHVFGPGGIDRFVDSGSNSLYGSAGWEQPVDSQINANTYYVELQTSIGTIVSERISVQFPQDCTRNLALVNFRRTRPA